MSEQRSFQTTYNRLKEIHTLLSTKEMLDIDNLVTMQKEAKELHDFLLDRLHTITKDIDAQTPLLEK